MLDKIVCAIYLCGVKDAGKSLLAAGLARLWASGATTPLASVTHDFNSALVENPIVFGDEEIPEGMTSGFLRSFIGCGSHPLRRKNMPESRVFGYFRLILAANNADLLHFEWENFGPEDIEAIASRILYIHCDPEAAAYLRSIGGRAGTEGWVDGDMIAEHALWLRDARKVEYTPGERFLVSGKVNAIHRRIASHGNVRGLATEWICKAMLSRKKWKDKDTGIRTGGGKVYVNASFVKSTWTDIVGDIRVPSLKKIGQALRPLARGEKRLPFEGRRADFYDIDPAFVYDACKELQLGIVEDFQAIIEAPDLVLVRDIELASKPAQVIPITAAVNGAAARGLFGGE